MGGVDTETGHNGKENPIGIETIRKQNQHRIFPGHNGKENPIGIETVRSSPQ